jgi:glutaredoxin 3
MTIKIYTTSTCPYCTMVKEFLDKNKVKYQNIDVAADPANAKEMIEKSGQMGVPVIDANGTMVIGFDEEKLKKALKL